MRAARDRKARAGQEGSVNAHVSGVTRGGRASPARAATRTDETTPLALRRSRRNTPSESNTSSAKTTTTSAAGRKPKGSKPKGSASKPVSDLSRKRGSAMEADSEYDDDGSVDGRGDVGDKTGGRGRKGRAKESGDLNGKGKGKGGNGDSGETGGGKGAAVPNRSGASSDGEQKKRRVGSASGGQKHEIEAQRLGLGYASADWKEVRLRVHETGGKTVRMLVCSVPFVDYIVCSRCGQVTTWSTAAKHTCDLQEESIRQIKIANQYLKEGNAGVGGAVGGADVAAHHDECFQRAKADVDKETSAEEMAVAGGADDKSRGEGDAEKTKKPRRCR